MQNTQTGHESFEVGEVDPPTSKPLHRVLRMICLPFNALARDFNRQVRDIRRLLGIPGRRTLAVIRANNQDEDVQPEFLEPVQRKAGSKLSLPSLGELEIAEPKKGRLVLPELPAKSEDSDDLCCDTECSPPISVATEISVAVEVKPEVSVPPTVTTIEPKKTRLLPLPPIPESTDSGLVEFQPNLRTRLADPEEELQAFGEPQSIRPSTAPLGFYRSFYLICPACQSEETYAMNSDGGFTRFKSDLGWFYQRMFCERCTKIYYRPGRVFLAPRPTIRPEDSKLYDA